MGKRGVGRVLTQVGGPAQWHIAGTGTNISTLTKSSKHISTNVRTSVRRSRTSWETGAVGSMHVLATHFLASTWADNPPLWLPHQDSMELICFPLQQDFPGYHPLWLWAPSDPPLDPPLASRTATICIEPSLRYSLSDMFRLKLFCWAGWE